MYCKNCGKEIKDGSLFCTNCGAKTEETENQLEKHRKISCGG